MARPRFALRGSHLLMWSSPLLLLVLVFTITSTPIHRPALTTTTSTSTEVTSTTTTTTTTTSPSTTATTRPPDGATTAPPTTHPTTTTTSAGSSNSTGESVVFATGSLDLNSPNDVVPLSGPGNWSVVATHPVALSLNCAGRLRTVSADWSLPHGQDCQLNIVVDTGATTAWTLSVTR